VLLDYIFNLGIPRYLKDAIKSDHLVILGLFRSRLLLILWATASWARRFWPIF